MGLKLTVIIAIACIASASGCTTMTANNIREVTEHDARGCHELGQIAGSDSIFVGLSAAIGTKNAKAKAMNAAVDLGATDVVWSQKGTSMTNEWIGKAYICKH